MKPGECEVVRIAGPGGLEDAVGRSAAVLKEGGVILYPTDTVYGLGGLATNPDALRRIYYIKGKPETKPSLVLVDSAEMAAGMAASVPPVALKLMQTCWPGPLTLVLRAAPGVSGILTAGKGKIGIRWPADEFCRRMVRRAGSPVVSTSANRSGVEPAGAFSDLLNEFRGDVDLAVDGGERAGKPSTIADVSSGSLIILREGAYSLPELIEAAAGNLDNRPKKV